MKNALLIFSLIILSIPICWGQELSMENPLDAFKDREVEKMEQWFRIGELDSLFIYDESYGLDKYLSTRKPSLKQLLKRNFRSKEDKIRYARAKRVLSLARLLDNERGLASEDLIGWLRTNPRSEIYPDDPRSLYNLYQQIRKWPKWSHYFQLSPNLTFPQLLKKYEFGIGNTEDRTILYSERFGYDLGLGANFPIFVKNPKLRYHSFWEVIFDLQMGRRSFQFEESLATTRLEGIPNSFSNLSFTEKVWNSFFNFGVKYNFLKPNKHGNINPPAHLFVSGGGNISHFWKAKLDAPTRISNFGESQDTPEIPISLLRRKWGYGAFTGFGVQILLGQNHLDFELRYNFLLNNRVRARKRYELDALIYQFGYVDPNFRIHTLNLIARYTFHHYSPTFRTSNKNKK